MKRFGCSFLFVLAMAASGLACAQNAGPSAAVACPKAHEATHAHLLGMWRAEFDGLSQGATLLLEKHPELGESVRGRINRNGVRAEVAGDVDEGEFTLEESENGVNISATWMGDVVEGSCGREIRGTWQAERGGRFHTFVLRKM
jgi:hypothetical protein